MSDCNGKCEAFCGYNAEIAQIVCGSCLRLLKYPPGAKQVQCSCCQTVNFVLEGSPLLLAL